MAAHHWDGSMAELLFIWERNIFSKNFIKGLQHFRRIFQNINRFSTSGALCLQIKT